jgi:hypothetical protein
MNKKREKHRKAIKKGGRPAFINWKLGFLEEACLQAHRLQPQKNLAFLDVISMYR